jgi:hypothetical protein
MMDLVLISPDCFQNASEELRKDEQMAGQACLSKSTNLKFVLEPANNKTSVIKKSMETNLEGLQFLSETQKQDKELMSLLIEFRPAAYLYCADELKNSFEYKLDLVSKNGLVLG